MICCVETPSSLLRVAQGIAKRCRIVHNPMNSEVRVVIADDHPIVRQGLREAIQSLPRFRIVVEAADGEALLEQITTADPHVAVLDIEMPKLDGFGVAREIQRRRLPVQVIFLTMHDAEDMFYSALDLGARGYILKETALPEIAAAVRTVAAGEYYVSKQLAAYLIRRRSNASLLAERLPKIDSLTATELRVLRHIADGRSSKEVADELFINYRTVENHRSNICEKLGISGHNALLKFALKHKAELP